MQIVCPNCKTSYQLADLAIGANGRSVRCVRCQTLWHAMPPAIPAPAADETAAVAAFRSELGSEPSAPLIDMATAPPTAPNEAEPSLDDVVGLHDDATRALAETPPAGLLDITIPVDDAPPLPPAGGG